MPFYPKMNFKGQIASILLIPRDRGPGCILCALSGQFSAFHSSPISQLCSPVALAALDEPIRGKGIEMSMQIPSKGIVLHQAVPTVFYAFAPA